MCGVPAYRLPTQIYASGCVLDIQTNCMCLPAVLLISFHDGATGTSRLGFIRRRSSLSFGILNEACGVYWGLIHDEGSVSEVSRTLDALMLWQRRNVICVDLQYQPRWQLSPLGALLMAIRLLNVRNELYSNLFECVFFHFTLRPQRCSASLTKLFCDSAVASSSVVLILPGFMVLCGALEIMSRNIVMGTVRMCYAVVCSLFLGLGLAVGTEAYERITGRSTDYTSRESRDTEGRGIRRVGCVSATVYSEEQ
ncbi:hypothetical protein C8F04DRAFT_1032289 [Mycena alexandri]|uniref:Threonine/serine exporter-like N-terminal domain-containing protein n=1 Tax=Mycena alexandri TaxID=1745969 RepID=A0AAD6XCR8_9AGAR|nr:hypothetical protein C8F04DRAFT_1032289 [Mycena alexandri]